MKKRELFRQVYNELLDYADTDLKNRCAQWGLKTHNLIKASGQLLGTMDTQDKDGVFIYAVSTACIVGKFGEYVNGVYLPADHEFDLDLLGLQFDDIKGYLDGYPDINPKHLEKFRRSNYVNLEDIWGTIFEYNKETHRGLYAYYKTQGKKYPDYEIYASLVAVFDETIEGCREGYNFISEGFTY